MNDPGQAVAGAAIDLAHLRRQCAGAADLEREVLGLFVSHTASQLPLLRAANTAERRQLAHAIRGAALGIGAFEVARSAEKIEKTPDGADTAALARAILAAQEEIAVLLAS